MGRILQINGGELLEISLQNLRCVDMYGKYSREELRELVQAMIPLIASEDPERVEYAAEHLLVIGAVLKEFGTYKDPIRIRND